MIRWRPYDFAPNSEGLIGTIAGVPETKMHYEVEPVRDRFMSWFWTRTNAGYIRNDCRIYDFDDAPAFGTINEAKTLCERHYNLLILQ